MMGTSVHVHARVGSLTPAPLTSAAPSTGFGSAAAYTAPLARLRLLGSAGTALLEAEAPRNAALRRPARRALPSCGAVGVRMAASQNHVLGVACLGGTQPPIFCRTSCVAFSLQAPVLWLAPAARQAVGAAYLSPATSRVHLLPGAGKAAALHLGQVLPGRPA